MKLIAKTLFGLEPFLEEELIKLGASNLEVLKRAVSFDADQALLYKVNYCSRFSIRILKSSYSFKAKDEQELYDKVRAIAWEEHLDVDQTFSIDPIVYSESFKHSKYASLRMKDAIVDRFRAQTGQRPSVDPSSPDLLLNMHISAEEVNLSIDSSGESLHKRGYKGSGHASPLNEVLAAGLIAMSGWTTEETLYDPMCGSGTLPIEAAMMAANIPAAKLREHFGFMTWNDFDAELWEKVKAECDAAISIPEDLDIRCSDIKGLYIRMVKTSAARLGIDEHIQVFRDDFFEQELKSGYVITNPPYGERLQHKNIDELYTDIADHLKQSFTGITCWLISSNMDALKFFGLKPSKRIKLYNGQLPCLYQRFDLYEGSKKGKYMQNEDGSPRTEYAEKDGQKDRTDSKPYQKKPFKREERKSYSKPDRPTADKDSSWKEKKDSDRRNTSDGPPAKKGSLMDRIKRSED